MVKAIRYVIFTGANERAVIAICRYFQREAIACSLVARPKGDLVRKTRFSQWIDATRRFDHLCLEDLLDTLSQLREKYRGQRLVFLPTAESVIRLVLDYRERFELAGLEIPLVDKLTYEAISDKSSFLALVDAFGVPLPPQLKQVESKDLPVVAKPLYEISKYTGQKLYPELIFTSEALEIFYSNSVKDDYFFQKYLHGKSYYFLFFLPRDGRPIVRYQENLAQQPNGKSMLAARLCHCPDVDIERRLLQSLQSLGYFGFVMVEFIEVNGVLHAIEANPRFWGPFELAIKAGFRPDAILEQKQAKAQAGRRKAVYLWTSGMILTLMEGKRPRCYPQFLRKLIAYPVALLGADIYLRLDTLRLLIYELSQAVRVGLARLGRYG